MKNKALLYSYNKETNEIKELPEMEEPEYGFSSYSEDVLKYNQHITSLKSYSVIGKPNWPEIVEENVDFKFINGRFVEGSDAVAGQLYAIPIEPKTEWVYHKGFHDTDGNYHAESWSKNGQFVYKNPISLNIKTDNMKDSKRELAMNWWNDIDEQKKIAMVIKHFPMRHLSSLTGREIEEIHFKEFPLKVDVAVPQNKTNDMKSKYSYDDMMNLAGWMAAADNKRPVPELKEEAEVYIKTLDAKKEPYVAVPVEKDNMITDVKELPEVADLDQVINTYVQGDHNGSGGRFTPLKHIQEKFWLAIDAINKSKLSPPISSKNETEDEVWKKFFDEYDSYWNSNRAKKELKKLFFITRKNI